MKKQRSPTSVTPPTVLGAGVHGDVFADVAIGADRRAASARRDSLTDCGGVPSEANG